MRDILRRIRLWWPCVLRSTYENEVAGLRRMIEEHEVRREVDAARVKALIWWRGMEPPQQETPTKATPETDAADDYRAGVGLPPLSNKTPCGAFLKHDSSGIAMKYHISKCQECQELLPDQYEE